MRIGFNKFQIYGKIILLSVILLLAMFFFLYPIPQRPNSEFPLPAILFLSVLVAVLICGLILIILELLFLPKGVYIDKTDKSLQLSFFGSKPYTIETGHINSYSAVTLRAKGSNYEGILLKTSKGRIILLSDFNLESFKPVKSLLENLGVPCNGIEQVKLVTYFINYLKKQNPRSITASGDQ